MRIIELEFMAQVEGAGGSAITIVRHTRPRKKAPEVVLPLPKPGPVII